VKVESATVCQLIDQLPMGLGTEQPTVDASKHPRNVPYHDTARRFCRDSALGGTAWTSVRTLPQLDSILPVRGNPNHHCNPPRAAMSQSMDGGGETVASLMRILRALDENSFETDFSTSTSWRERDPFSGTHADTPSAQTSVPSHFIGLCGVHYQVAATRAKC